MTHIAQEELQTSENLFGWDETPGIVSVWASRAGKALVWRRIGEQVVCEEEQFRPWLFARILTDLEHLGSRVQPATSVGAGSAAAVSGECRYRCRAFTHTRWRKIVFTFPGVRES